MEQIFFDGKWYNVADLDPVALLYIQTYNAVTASAPNIGPDANDFNYRMQQALQMFGDPVVIESIQNLIENPPPRGS